MKLARPYRRAPLEIARALAAADRTPTPSPATLADRVGRGRAARASSTCASPTGALEATIDAVLGATRRVGPRRRRSGRATGQRRVRVGQPDRAADHRQRPRRVRRRPAQPGPRGRRPAGHARVLLQRLGRPGHEPRRVGRRDPTRRADPRGRLPRRLRRRARAASSPTTSGPRPTAPGADPADVVGRWAAARRPRAGSRRPSSGSASTSTSGRPRRSLHDERLGRPGDRAAPGGRPRLRAGRRAVVPLDDVRRRQGPGDHPLRRPADLLRRRHRLRHREVQPRLRPPHLHLGRRPPRDGGPGPQRRRGDGLRQGRRPDAAHSLGPLRPRRRRRSRCSKRAGEFITLDELLAEVGVDAARWFFASRGGDTRDRLRHRAGEEAVEREPGLLRPVRPRPDRLDPAQGGRGGARPGGGVAGPARRRPRRPPWRGSSSASPRSSRTRPRPRRRRASPPTRPSSRPRSTPSIATRGSSTRTSRSARRRAWPSWPRRRITLANALGLLGISRARVDVARSPATVAGRAPSRRVRGRPQSSRRVVEPMTTQRSRPPAPGSTCARAGQPSRRVGARPPRTRPRPRRVSQSVRRTTAQAPSGPSTAPSGRRPSPPRRRSRSAAAIGVRAASQTPSWNSPNVSCEPTFQPAPSRVARSAGSVDGDRRLAGRVLVRVEDLLGRVGRLRERRVDRRASRPAIWSRWHEREPGRVREQERLAEDRGGIVVERPAALGSLPTPRGLAAAPPGSGSAGVQ